ncbi:MAG: cytochrome-c oxidase, cbb3-type subunit III [Pseudomonadota bacterium]
MSKKDIDDATGIETTGHEWDGLKELNNPLPRWWLYILYATIIWAIGYMILYPSIPLINQGWPGVLGWSSRGDVAQELDGVAESRKAFDARIAALSFDEIRADPALFNYAQRSGASAFKLVCSQCHGSGAVGDQELGYPNLNDDAWLWGGTMDAIYHTISHGVRNGVDPAARNSVMPAYGTLGILTAAQIADTAHHVLSLSGLDHDGAAAARGTDIYMTQCAACHGPDGAGNPILGAPRLSDALWLYGASHAQVVAQISNPRLGVMPPWAERFDEATRKKLAIYVHQLGGGQ